MLSKTENLLCTIGLAVATALLTSAYYNYTTPHTCLPPPATSVHEQYVQFHDFRENRARRDTGPRQYQQNQERFLKEALDPWTPDPLTDFLNRQAADRANAIQTCNFIDRNAAARSACLEAIR